MVKNSNRFNSLVDTLIAYFLLFAWAQSFKGIVQCFFLIRKKYDSQQSKK